MKLIDSILDSRAASLVGRVLLTSSFLESIYSKLTNWPGALGEMMHFNLAPAPAYAIATLITHVVGVGLIIWGRFAWVGAGMLGVFTALTIPIGHHFWTLTGHEAQVEKFFAFEHVSVIGGLILAAMLCRREGHPT